MSDKESNKPQLLTRSLCPITNALDIIGDKWTLIVVRDLFLGCKTYGEFQRSPEKIPTNILAERLKRLDSMGIVNKRPYQDRPVRYEYLLSDKGKALGPILKALKNWGLEYIDGTDTSEADAQLKRMQKAQSPDESK